MPRTFKTGTDEEKVISLSDVREEKIEEKRREYERVVFKSNFGVYTVLDRKGLHAIEIIDISEGGLQFQVPESSTLKLETSDTITLRFYFSADHFITIDVKVMRSFTSIEEGTAMHRYGCIMDKSMASYSAIYHFVQFIAKCAEHGHKDDTHLKVYY